METPPPIFPAVPPPLPAPKRGGAKWVFLGCGGCLTLLILGGLCFAGFVWLVMGAIKGTDVYAEAFKRMQNSAQVQESLGTPIEAGWMFQGSVNYANGAGNADISVPVTGPKGEATLVAKATKQSGEAWQYSVMEVRLAGGGTIDLKGSPQLPP